MNKWGKKFWIDLGERVGATFLGALLTMLTATNQDILVGSVQQWWVMLGLPTVLSLVKGLIGNLTAPGSGASLVPPPEGPRVEGGQYGIIQILVFIVVVLLLLWLIFGVLVPRL